MKIFITGAATLAALVADCEMLGLLVLLYWGARLLRRLFQEMAEAR